MSKAARDVSKSPADSARFLQPLIPIWCASRMRTRPRGISRPNPLAAAEEDALVTAEATPAGPSPRRGSGRRKPLRMHVQMRSPAHDRLHLSLARALGDDIARALADPLTVEVYRNADSRVWVEQHGIGRYVVGTISDAEAEQAVRLVASPHGRRSARRSADPVGHAARWRAVPGPAPAGRRQPDPDDPQAGPGRLLARPVRRDGRAARGLGGRASRTRWRGGPTCSSPAAPAAARRRSSTPCSPKTPSPAAASSSSKTRASCGAVPTTPCSS